MENNEFCMKNNPQVTTKINHIQLIGMLQLPV